MEDKGLLVVIHQLVTDVEFRKRFAIAPRETMIEELGISREVYDSLIVLVPVLFVGGLFLLGDASGGRPLDPTSAPNYDWTRR